MASDRQCFSWLCSGGADGDLLWVVLHGPLDLELADMNFTNKEYEDARRLQMNGCPKPVGKYRIKHPVLAAAMIFYVIGFLIGYVWGNI